MTFSEALVAMKDGKEVYIPVRGTAQLLRIYPRGRMQQKDGRWWKPIATLRTQDIISDRWEVKEEDVC